MPECLISYGKGMPRVHYTFPVIMEMAYVLLHSKFIDIPHFLLDFLVTSISHSLLHSLMNQHATFSAAFPSYQVTFPGAFPMD